MPYTTYSLPQYPVKTDVWQTLKNETRPIMVYGMGNGADKLFSQFEKYSINISEVFASDGFVRGHSYRGYKVKSFSEIKANYSDFVIVISFASNKPDVVEMLSEIDTNYETYIPDMPIANAEEFFDKDFYNENYQDILKAYNMLCDNESKSLFAAIINYRLSGKMQYLLNSYSEKYEVYSLINTKKIETLVDAGAYNGDTAAEAIEYFKDLKKIYAIEPDKRNFKKLSRFFEDKDVENELFNAAAYSADADGLLYGSGNRNSTLSATASYENKSEDVKLISIDRVAKEKIDYIKYDVEGAELDALIGSHKTIEKYSPALLVSLYHRSRDVFSLLIYLSRYEGYEFYMRRFYCLPAWELMLIMIPKTLEK